MATTELTEANKVEIANQMHTEMEEVYPAYDREGMADVARAYMDAIDKEGFIFNFNEAWEWAGYATKASAKRVLQKYLRENIDYKITLDIVSSSVLNQTQGTEMSRRGGDRKTERIMMTARGFSQFSLSARTPIGQTLRDVVFSLTRIMKQFIIALQTGTHRIVRVRSSPEEQRDTKRIKVCDTQKALMREVVDKNPSFAKFCGKINGETNKAATGRYKHETAKLLDMKPKRVNARDYMTPAQLAIAEAMEIMTRNRIRESDGTECAFDIHKDICERTVANIKDEIHGKIASEPRNLRDARKVNIPQAIEYTPAQQTTTGPILNANTMNCYFSTKPESIPDPAPKST